MTKEKKTTKERIKSWVIIFGWLLVWEISDHVVDNRIILVGPLGIIDALWYQMTQSDFLITCAASFLRIAIGFFVSVIGGFCLAIVCYKCKIIKDIIQPVMTTLKSIPLVSIVIMLLIWVGNQALTSWLAVLICLPIIYTSTLAGFQNVDPSMLEMAETFQLSPLKKFMYIYRPSFMPFLTSACESSLGMSWKAGMMAEVLATPKPSIGRELFAAQTYLQISNLFAWTVVVIVLSLVFEKSFMRLLRQFNKPGGGFLTSGQEEDPL